MNNQIFKQAQHLVAQNSAALLTGTGVVGVITTAVLTGKAAIKADQVLTEARTVQVSSDLDSGYIPEHKVLTITDQIKLVGPIYAPAVASGLTTIGAIVFSYRISVSRSAALAAAYGISEKAFQEYKDKVIEQVTPKKAQEIKEAVIEQKLQDNPPPVPFLVSEGQVMCLDAFSGQYFRSTMEELRRAENSVNVELQKYNTAKLKDFYTKVGIETVDIMDSYSWGPSDVCEIDYSTMLADGRPCIVIQFVNPPRPTYDDMNKYI